MLNLKERVAFIEKVLEKGSKHALIYAALECRMTIEYLCYERLQFAYGYASASELRKWQPKAVLAFLKSELGHNATRGFTLSMSRNPVSDDGQRGADDLADSEFVILGEQKGLDPRLIEKLWQSLSSFLHVRPPKEKTSDLELYESTVTLRKVVDDAVAEFRRLSTGTMISSGLVPNVKFTCLCGYENRRSTDGLGGRTVECVNLDCDESWIVTQEGEVYHFRRDVIEVACANCCSLETFARKRLQDVGIGRGIKFQCKSCSHENKIFWQLARAN
jgi:hypothetical protein